MLRRSYVAATIFIRCHLAVTHLPILGFLAAQAHRWYETFAMTTITSWHTTGDLSVSFDLWFDRQLKIRYRYQSNDTMGEHRPVEWPLCRYAKAFS